MAVDLEAQRLQLLLVGEGGGLLGEAGQHHASDQETVAGEGVHQAQQVHIIGDAEVAADFVFLDISDVDGNNDLHLVAEFLEHPDLGVRVKAGKHAGRVVVVEQLAAEFQIELASEAADALADVLGLRLQIFVVVKTDSVHALYSLPAAEKQKRNIRCGLLLMPGKSVTH